MIIRVTGGTAIMRQRIGKIGHVTFSAVYPLVFSQQIEAGHTMVELIQGTGHMKGFFIVTFRAIASEFIVMNILMTGCTMLKIDVSKTLKLLCVFLFLRMTPDTGHFPMTAL
jgi:hypothetical protein